MTRVVAAVLSILVFGPIPAQGETVTFDAVPLGEIPADFEFWRTGNGAAGRWIAVRDAEAQGSRALEQTSTDPTDYRFPLAIYKPISAKNVEVTVRFKAVSGKVDQAGGIAVRLTSPDSYYVVRANALEGNVRFYHVIKGRRTELKGANVKVASNQWHTLRLKAEGERFAVSFNLRELFTVNDGRITDVGKVALWTKADSVTRFDRLEIKTLP